MFWSKIASFCDIDIPSDSSFRYGVYKGFHDIKVQTLWPWKPHASFKVSFWPFKPQNAMHGGKV